MYYFRCFPNFHYFPVADSTADSVVVPGPEILLVPDSAVHTVVDSIVVASRTAVGSTVVAFHTVAVHHTADNTAAVHHIADNTAAVHHIVAD